MMVIHVVQPGETLYAIAGRYGVDPDLLRVDNGVPESGALAVGQTLVIQSIRTFHIVQPGQTLAAVAAQYGVPLRAMYRNNIWLAWPIGWSVATVLSILFCRTGPWSRSGEEPEKLPLA